MKRRFLCLLLVLCMLPIQSFAVNSGVGQTHNSTATSDGETASGHSTGVALGIQTMDDRAEYQVKSKNGNEAEFLEGAAVNNKGLAAAARHFLYSYPEPDTKNALTASTVYIVPMRAAEPKYMTGTDGGKLYLTDITGHYYASEQRAGYSSKNPIYNTMDMSISNYLYAAATGGKFDKEAGADAYDYFNGYIEKMYLPIARDLIGYVFANYKDYHDSSGNWNQVDVDKVNACWKKVYAYNTANLRGDDKTIRQICNYAAVLLSLARLLPEENWDLYEQNISQFVVNAIRGEAYYPVLITAEMCCAYRYSHANIYAAWMTVPEYFTICSSTSDESQFHHADTSPLNVTALGSGDKNMAQTILKAARKNVGANAGYNYHCGSVVGLDMYGKDIVNSNKVGDWCRAMTSLSDAAINSIRNDWGLSVPNTAEALWGCGIFGGTEALTIEQPDPDPVIEAGAQIAGKVDITIDTSGLPTQEAQGSGQLKFPVTITIDTETSAKYEKTQSGDIVEKDEVAAGSSFWDYLTWYSDHKEELGLKGQPELRIWLKGEVREGSNLSDGSDLMNSTYGQFNGDGTEQAAAEEALRLEFDTKSLKEAATKAFGIEPITDGMGGGIKLDFSGYTPTAEEKKNKIITITTDVVMDYTLDGDDAVAEFWFKAGVGVQIVTPVVDDRGLPVQGGQKVQVGLDSVNKYVKYTLTAIPSPEKKTPTYKSTIAPAYSELKQGTPGNEIFNSMTGTPTNTNGTYYQYFASGGSEFVVEFEAEYVENATATRTFTWNFEDAPCTLKDNHGNMFCEGHCNGGHTKPDGKGGTTSAPCPAAGHCIPCTNRCCKCDKRLHDPSHPHTLAAEGFKVTVNYTGLSYMKITNLKVWKLSQAKLDGTRELLDTNEVYATVQNNATKVSYNVAAYDTAAAGRIVYEYDASGDAHGGKPDALVFKHSLVGNCGTEASQAQSFVDADLAAIKLGAYCVSDYIVLHTSEGDQSICYYEYKSQDWGSALASKVTVSYTAEAVPSTGPAITTAQVSESTFTIEVAFDTVDYDTMWTNNKSTVTADVEDTSKLNPTGITYGGYNGNYKDVNGKYKSSGFGSNINWSSTQAAQNASGAYKNNAGKSYTASKPFYLLKTKLSIPDTKINGEYIVGDSYVFYEQVVNAGKDKSKAPTIQGNFYGDIGKQSMFGGKTGFVLHTTYSPDHDKINDVVVYDPVSCEDAVVVSLPEERDQRVSTHEVAKVELSATCPGDASCSYLKNTCEETNHIHTEDCYKLQEYTVHGANNIHEHTDECGGSKEYVWYHNNRGCSYSYQLHWSDSNSRCSQCGHSCGACYTYYGGIGDYLWINYHHRYAISYPASTNYDYTYCSNHISTYRGILSAYTCNNLPLNAHECSAGAGELASGESKDFTYTGTVQSVTLEPGTYKLETWGAQGAQYSDTPGYGGYSAGTITLDKQTTLYVVVGGQGVTTTGGYNGGGQGSGVGYAGGGATHIATSTGTLASLSSNKSSVIIVAGGGGGSQKQYGGNGGGANQSGVQCTVGCGSNAGAGTLTSGYAFGQGGPALQGSDGYYGGAGGGGYYGGYGSTTDYSLIDDKGGSGGSGYADTSRLTDISGTTGTNTGNGKARITCLSVEPTCYQMNKAVLNCSNPHHAHSYNWKLYTYGLMHESGNVCTGRSCTDTTDVIFPTQEAYTLPQCASGSIVRHNNGTYHLTTETNGKCTYCGSTYKEVISKAQSTDRTPAESEYTCYTYGDSRCWSPCGDPANHNVYNTTIKDDKGNVLYEMGDFINLDYEFQIYFPNTGHFYGTNAAWSSYTSAERGKGYGEKATDVMDTTPWVEAKWVQFPFAVIYNNQTYLAYERVYLKVKVKDDLYTFYCPLHNSEVANAEIQFGTVAINNRLGNTLECRDNESSNKRIITYRGKDKSHHHNASKLTYIDVVGRIGNMTLEDTGDFRYSNLFKQSLTEWAVKNVVHKVDITKPNYVAMDPVDIRGKDLTNTKVLGDTYGTKTERSKKVISLPLTPEKNNVAALRTQPIRVGYDSYYDFMTIGNYYGNTIYDDDGNVEGQNLVLIKPHYYRLDLDTGAVKAVDVYIDVNGTKYLINDADSNTVSYSSSLTDVSLNWVEEQARRNYSGSEVTISQALEAANDWMTLPSSTSWIYGNYNLLNLTQRNRTFVGSEYTYGKSKDPSDRLEGSLAAVQGQRWHFQIGLPSSATFVYSGQAASQANIDACTSGNAVILCALEAYAQGEVWTLAYDGSSINQPFQVIPGGKTYDPVITYPDGSGTEMPIVSVISINHSSKEDLSVAGTQ